MLRSAWFDEDTSRCCFECNLCYYGALSCPSCGSPSGEPVLQSAPNKAEPPASSILKDLNPDAIAWDNFDAAIIGYAHRCGMEPVLLYDREKMIEVLVAQGMQWEGAEEYLSFNVEGAWVGEHTPMIATLV